MGEVRDLSVQQLFVAAFAPFTRVGLAWGAVAHSDWQIDARVTDSRADLASWYFPWYLGPDGTAVDYLDPNGRPIAIGEWDTLRPAGLSFRRSDVDLQAARFREVTERAEVDLEAARFHEVSAPAQVVVPAYGLPDDRLLVLDGNHRLAALMQETELAFHCTAVVLHGPIDEAVLSDLRHWV